MRIRARGRLSGRPMPSPPALLGQVRGRSEGYRALARAVILQAVKDAGTRVQHADGPITYRDHGRRTHAADTARTFLSTPSPELTFWCLWLNIHPETIINGAKRMVLSVADGETIH
jgi:hypothetical protein